MKKLFEYSCIALLTVTFLISSCTSHYSDMQTIIYSEFKDAKQVFYPSTDNKVSAVVVDKNGDVWYLRVNGFGEMRDKVKLFNTIEYCEKE